MKGLQKNVNSGLARIDFRYFRFMNGTHSCVNMRVKWRESFSGWFSFTDRVKGFRDNCTDFLHKVFEQY